MHSKRQAGFTLIELLIVTIIVGVLATLVAMTYSGVKTGDRNNERQANIKTLQSYLETYYAEHDKYPTFDNLASMDWRKENLKDMPADALRDPSWGSKIKECTADNEAIPAQQPIEKCYSYEVSTADGSACDNDKTPCAQYTLTATLEGGDKYVKASLN
jgi:prepilin-type N-terminal cleavage/methylation domain-containing protein